MSKRVSKAAVLALIEAAIADEYMSPAAKLYRLRYDVQDLPTINESICSDTDTISRQDAIDALCELYEYQRAFDPTEAADLVRQGIYLAEKKIEQLPSAEAEVKPIDYQECSNAMLKMWMDNVVTDVEYNHIMDKLNAHWGMSNE